ncbi:MAG: hypothetical protein AAFV93_01935 [Chloroflexota bacterium]
MFKKVRNILFVLVVVALSAMPAFAQVTAPTIADMEPVVTGFFDNSVANYVAISVVGMALGIGIRQGLRLIKGAARG